VCACMFACACVVCGREQFERTLSVKDEMSVRTNSSQRDHFVRGRGSGGRRGSGGQSRSAREESLAKDIAVRPKVDPQA
jgi:hypothetical protein